MPWQSADSPAQHDRRLDEFRGRVGLLRRDGAGVGHVLVEVEAVNRIVSGHLWWRRWSEPYEALQVTSQIDGEQRVDWVLDEAHLGSELDAWRRGEFVHFDDDLTVEWVPESENASTRATLFGV